MIDILDYINYRDRITSVNNEYLVSVLNSNLKKRKEWYSKHKSSVSSSHPCCSIIRSMGISKTTTDDQLLRKSKVGIKTGESYGFTSSSNVKSYCNNVFFNGRQIVLIVRGKAEDDPIRVVYHEGKDLSMPVIDNLYIKGEPPIVIISTVPLAIKYRDHGTNTTIASFVSMHLLVDMVESYSEISLFNIMTSEGDALYSIDGNHPFYPINEAGFVRKVKSDYNKRFLGKRKRLESSLSSVPFIKNEYTKTFDVKDIPEGYQTSWIKILVSFNMLIRMLDITSDPLKQNRSIISRFKIVTKIMKKSRTIPEDHSLWYDTLMQKLEDYK